MAAYLGSTVLTEDEKMSAMIYWNATVKRIQIAKVYLTLSASSVPIESIFSLAGLVKNSRRSSVAPYRLNRLCYVHDNYAKKNSTEIIQPLLWLWFHHSDSDSYQTFA